MVTMELEKEKIVGPVEIGENGGDNQVTSAALHTEADLAEHPDEEALAVEELHEQSDYSQFTKAQLVAQVKELLQGSDMPVADRAVKEIKSAFDELREKERAVALNRFILDGGSPDDFDYRGDEDDAAFESALRQLRDRKQQQIRNLEDQKNTNLTKKEEILERLRELIDSQEVTDQFDQFKALQQQWKATGAVPPAQARTIWANYHALVDRFYDNQSIYYELKELDRKKNLEAKLELCIRAEKLVEAEILKDAIRELNELHHEFKHVGPVPKEDKEAVWQRFKAASDAVYARRDEYVKNLQQQLSANVEKKEAMCQEVQAYAEFTTDRIKDWNQKTKEILDLQKRWEALGGLPRAKSRDINKKFWTAFKTFFSNKSAFFKKLDEERGENLAKKNELIQRALELKDSNDWAAATNEMKKLQQLWKDIGPVPEKMRQKLFDEFKGACDYFFEQRRSQLGQKASEQDENLKAKLSLIDELEKHVADKTATVDVLHTIEEKFTAIGFVPRKNMNTVRERYDQAVQKFVDSLSDVTDDKKSKLLLEHQLQELKNDPYAGEKLYHKEQTIRKRMQKVENDIAVWRNNLEFFARAKNADSVRTEFNQKIDEASEQLRQLKDQLKMLRSVS
jgi:hypothetical protein